MEPDEMSETITEIGIVPYLGLPECKNCQNRISEVIEQRIHTNTGEVVFDTHLQCKKAECTDCIFAQKHYDAERKRLEKRKLKKAADKAGKQQI